MARIYGIGTDIVECLRIAQMIERHGEQFLTRVFTSAEIQYCQSRAQATQHFAARWAAKEAVLKALGIGLRKGLSWRDIEIKNEPTGVKPQVVLRGTAKEMVESMDVEQVLITLAHCRSHATAYAVAIAEPELE